MDCYTLLWAEFQHTQKNQVSLSPAYLALAYSPKRESRYLIIRFGVLNYPGMISRTPSLMTDLAVPWASLVDFYRATVDVLSIHCSDGCLAFIIIWHLNETKAA